MKTFRTCQNVEAQAPLRCGRSLFGQLLMAGAIIRVAVLAGMTEVPVARIAGVAFAGLGRHQSFATMRKALELDGGERIVHHHHGRDAHESYEQRLHS
jgi:hypothetical protein